MLLTCVGDEYTAMQQSSHVLSLERIQDIEKEISKYVAVNSRRISLSSDGAHSSWEIERNVQPPSNYTWSAGVGMLESPLAHSWTPFAHGNPASTEISPPLHVNMRDWANSVAVMSSQNGMSMMPIPMLLPSAGGTYQRKAIAHMLASAVPDQYQD